MNRDRSTSALLIAALIGLGLVVGRLIPPLIVRLGGNVPRLSWAAPLTLFLAAFVVGIIAWNTWQSLHKKHQRMTSDHGIKMLALAKSCAVVASLVAGVYGGFALAFIEALDSPLGKERVVRGTAAAVASLLLLVAALLLERACRVPGDDDEGKNGKAAKGRPDATPA
jgi:MFS family permease